VATRARIGSDNDRVVEENATRIVLMWQRPSDDPVTIAPGSDFHSLVAAFLPRRSLLLSIIV